VATKPERYLISSVQASTASPAASGNVTSSPVPFGSAVFSSSPMLGYPLQAVPTRLTAKNITARAIADRIIDLCHEHGEVITNIRLQKLLYYAQAWYLALKAKPLFADTFEAWPNGPVQPDVYAAFSRFGTSQIERPAAQITLPKAVESHLGEVLRAYGRMSAYELSLLACQEAPWIEARAGLPSDAMSRAEILQSSMLNYYKSRLDGQKTKK